MKLKATWSVAVIYDEAKAREIGMAFCDSLVEKFWAENEFDVSWWSVGVLQEPNAAEQALKRSVEADVVVFAIGTELPDCLHDWTKQWLSRRGRREGALVGLIARTKQAGDGMSEVDGFLRHLAHSAGMDFLTEVPQTIPRRLSESLESCCERAHQVTAVLDGILHQPGSVPRSPR